MHWPAVTGIRLVEPDLATFTLLDFDTLADHRDRVDIVLSSHLARV